MKRPVACYSEGVKLRVDIYLPDDPEAGEKRAGIVLCHGYTGVKELYLPDTARALNHAGYVVVSFDYKGWGESDGPRSRLAPYGRVLDVQATMTFFSLQPEVHAGRLGIYGRATEARRYAGSAPLICGRHVSSAAWASAMGRVGCAACGGRDDGLGRIQRSASPSVGATSIRQWGGGQVCRYATRRPSSRAYPLYSSIKHVTKRTWRGVAGTRETVGSSWPCKGHYIYGQRRRLRRKQGKRR